MNREPAISGPINVAKAIKADSHVLAFPDTCPGKTSYRLVQNDAGDRTLPPLLLGATQSTRDPACHASACAALVGAAWIRARGVGRMTSPAEDHASSGNLDQQEVNLLIAAMNHQGGEYRIFNQSGQQGMVRIVKNGLAKDMVLAEDSLDAETYLLFIETRATIEEFSGTEIIVPGKFCLVSSMPDQMLTEDGAFCVYGKETYAFRDQDLIIMSAQTFSNRFRRYCMFAHEAGNAADRQAGLSAQEQQAQGLKREHSMLQALELVGISADEVASLERELARIDRQRGLGKPEVPPAQGQQFTVSKAPLILEAQTGLDHGTVKAPGPSEQIVPIRDWQLSITPGDITRSDSETLSLQGNFGQVSFSASVDIGSRHLKVLTALGQDVEQALMLRLKRSAAVNHVLMEAREAKMQATKNYYETLQLHIDEAEARAKDSLTGVHLREITIKGALGHKYAFTASINNSKGNWSVPPYDTSQLADIVAHKLITQDTKALAIINKEVGEHPGAWKRVVMHNRSSFPKYCNWLFPDETSADFMGRSR